MQRSILAKNPSLYFSRRLEKDKTATGDKMKVKKIISKSKDGNKMEVIAEVYHGNLKTFHIHRHSKKWKFFAGYEKNQPILKAIELEAK